MQTENVHIHILHTTEIGFVLALQMKDHVQGAAQTQRAIHMSSNLLLLNLQMRFLPWIWDWSTPPSYCGVISV